MSNLSLEEEEEENLFVNQINTVQNVSEETNDWLPKRASLSSWSPKIELVAKIGLDRPVYWFMAAILNWLFWRPS